ncbi:hypothetical protein HMPREF0971_00027 [Segatella oris F0302]|uniref:Uncharacterized protein n=1 Tax=Segatella oris F0302 TaxID=649760 RepID=D1QM45_9BACT|nr:hypothetical protein HMPREF0971_00027 [Segatella oris F0302]
MMICNILSPPLHHKIKSGECRNKTATKTFCENKYPFDFQPLTSQLLICVI